MSVTAKRHALPKQMLFQPILDLDNKLKEGTESFNELLKRYKCMSLVLCSCCSSAYIFIKKRTTSEGNFNNYAKILITPIL